METSVKNRLKSFNKNNAGHGGARLVEQQRGGPRRLHRLPRDERGGAVLGPQRDAARGERVHRQRGHQRHDLLLPMMLHCHFRKQVRALTPRPLKALEKRPNLYGCKGGIVNMPDLRAI